MVRIGSGYHSIVFEWHFTYSWLASVGSSSFILLFNSHVNKCSVVAVCFLFHWSNFPYPSFESVFQNTILKWLLSDDYVMIPLVLLESVVGKQGVGFMPRHARMSIMLSKAGPDFHLCTSVVPPALSSCLPSLAPQISAAGTLPTIACIWMGEGQRCQLFICGPHSHLHS